MRTRVWRFDTDNRTWRLQMWEQTHGIAQSTTTSNGMVADPLPEWLSDIVSVAKAGGHTIHYDIPPLAMLFWFVTDEHNNFIKFDTPEGQT